MNDYFVFRSIFTKSDEQLIQAEFQDENQPLLDNQNLLWENKPLPLPLVENIAILINRDHPVPDIYWTGNLVQIFPEKVLSILGEHGVNFKAYPAKFVDRVTGVEVNLTSKVFHLLEVEDALDFGKTTFETKQIGNLRMKMLRKPVLSREFLDKGKPFVRISSEKSVTLMRFNLKQILEREKTTGCMFLQLSDMPFNMDHFRG